MGQLTTVFSVYNRVCTLMLMPKYDRSSITPENPTRLCHRWIPPSQHSDQKSWCLGCFWSYFFLVCRTYGHTYDFPFVGKRQHRNKNTTYTTTNASSIIIARSWLHMTNRVAAVSQDMWECVWGAGLVVLAWMRLSLSWFGTPSGWELYQQCTQMIRSSRIETKFYSQLNWIISY
jgi:hypothetical protein